MKLFFDTETTGKADFKKPIQDPCQPRLVQLGAILTTDEGEATSFFKMLIKPEGFVIPEEVTREVHGISHEHAMKYGLPIKCALNAFEWFVWAAQSTHAFNHDFDSLVMCNELFRQNKGDPFQLRKVVCEMLAMKDVMKLKPNFPGGDWKWPKLSQAHEFCFGVPHDGAHDALADVRATIAIHKWRLAQKV